jgi:hypothetical protein
MTRMGLLERGLLNSVDEQSLLHIEELCLSLKAMAEKELAGQPLTEREYERIRYYGGELEHLTFAAADEYQGPGASPTGEDDPQAAVIADVATHPGRGEVLEVGIGRISTIYTIVPIEGELVVTKGGVFSYYEFPWPMNDRLTDEKWRDMLDSGQAPAPPGWTASFFTESTEDSALRQSVWLFNEHWIAAAWWPAPSRMEGAATGEALQWAQGAAQALIDDGFYEGHHLVDLRFLSFDLQDADHAIVTTSETWWAERYEMGPYPEDEGVLFATRPEYTLGVVYHVERVDGQWLVSKVLIQGEIPAWQEVTP